MNLSIVSDTISDLCNMEPGESVIYMTGPTSWSGNIRNIEIKRWCERAHKTGRYIFTQRLLDRDQYGYGKFDYIVKRLR